MRQNSPRRSIVGLLALLLLGCEGAPCPDNDDAPCLPEASGRVCNMAVPAADPDQGTCRAPAELNAPCAETADCAAGACVFDPYSGPCSTFCCDGQCGESPACIPCIFFFRLEAAIPCCWFSCMNAPACQAYMSLFDQLVCKALVGDSCERNLDCFGSEFGEFTCYEAENVCVEMGPGSPCDDAADCSGDLACNPATRACEAPAAG